MDLDYYLGIGPYVRPALSYDVDPPLGQGTKPASWDHGDWPEGKAS